MRLCFWKDLIKPKEEVLPAYNDAEGVTKAFNFNLLHRINRELGGNFNVEAFSHEPEYDEQTGVARSFITSLTNQSVHITALNQTFSFTKGERIQTETSRKYNNDIINKILIDTHLEITHQFFDTEKRFVDLILRKK